MSALSCFILILLILLWYPEVFNADSANQKQDVLIHSVINKDHFSFGRFEPRDTPVFKTINLVMHISSPSEI